LLETDKNQIYVFNKKIIVNSFEGEYFINIRYCPKCGKDVNKII
jgi:hypothetical protein